MYRAVVYCTAEECFVFYVGFRFLEIWALRSIFKPLDDHPPSVSPVLFKHFILSISSFSLLPSPHPISPISHFISFLYPLPPYCLCMLLVQYHKLVYAEDVLLLNDYNRDYNAESEGPKILCIALPAGKRDIYDLLYCHLAVLSAWMWQSLLLKHFHLFSISSFSCSVCSIHFCLLVLFHPI